LEPIVLDLIASSLVPVAGITLADIDITPNTNGPPGIAQLRTIVGAVMTVGLILSVLALIISAIVWGVRGQQLKPAPGLAGQGRRSGLLRGGGHADQLLLKRRPSRMTASTTPGGGR
jgi:hypothetical protein